MILFLDIIFILLIVSLVGNVIYLVYVDIKKYKRMVNGFNNRVVPIEAVPAIPVENVPENSIIVDAV